MKSKFLRSFVSSIVLCSSTAYAADVNAVATGAWTAGTTWSNGSAAAAGNTYTIDGFTVTSPTNGNTITFPGTSITIAKTGATAGVLDLARLHAATEQIIATTLPPVTISNGATLQFRAQTGSNRWNLAAASSINVSGTVLFNNTGGGYGQNINLAGPVSGSGLIEYKTANSGSATTERTLTLNSASSSYSGNWFIQHPNSGDDFGTLTAGAANALGTGTVTLDTRARLRNNAVNGLNSLSGVVLNHSTSSLILNGANAWNNTAASLTINAGTVTLASSNSSIGAMTVGGSATLTGTTGHLAPGSILATAGTLGGTGTLAPRASATIANTGATTGPAINTPFVIDASGITFNLIDSNASGSDLFMSGAVSGSASFTKTGPGALAFGGSVNLSGLIAHNQGILQLNNAPAKSFTGGFSGSGQINVGGTGLTTISGPSGSYTGTINVADGASLAGEAVTNANLNLGSSTGANLWPDFATPTAAFTANNITLNGVNAIRFNTFPAPGTYTLLKYNGILNGTAANFSAPFRGASINTTGGVGGNEITLTVGAAAALVWNNAAATSVWDNAVSANWNNGGSNDVFFDQDSVIFNDSPGSDQTIAITDTVAPASMTFPATNDTVNYSFTGGSIGGLGNLVKSGDATLTLATSNSYSGGTTLNEGRLRVGANSALGTGLLTINGGTLSSDGTSPWTLPNNLVLSANPTFGNATDNGALTLSGNLTLSESRTITTDSDVILSGVLGGSFSLTKAGTGRLALTGANTYSGVTTVSAGTLETSLSTTLNALGNGAVTIDSGATLQVNNLNTATAAGPTFANTLSGTGLLKYNFAAGTTARNAYITGLAGFNGTLQLTTPGTTGDKITATAGINAPGLSVIIDSGTQLYIATNPSTFASVSFAGTGNSENRGAIRLGNTLNANLTLNGSATIGSEGGTVNGSITSGSLGTQTLTVGTSNSVGNSTFLGPIGGGSGNIEVVNLANGTMTLAAANTYTGATYVDQGTLNLRGSIAGDLYISNAVAATLSGEGSVGGSVILGDTGVNANLIFDPMTAGALSSTGPLVVAEPATVVSVSFSQIPANGGTFTLLNHGGTTAAPANFAFTGTGYRPHTFDTTTSSTAVTLTVPSENLTWLGTSPVWDVDSTPNWKSASVNPEKFYHLDAVTFDDTAPEKNPTLAVTVNPSSVNFINNTAYTLSGAGAIGGSGTLNKSGSGTTTLSTANTFTGNVNVSDGKLVLGNAGALGASTLGAKLVTVNGAGQIDLNNFNNATPTRTYTLRIAGDGDGNGAIINEAGTGVASNAGLLNLELLGSAAIGGSQRYDLGFAAGAGSGAITGNGHTLTKVGSNQVHLRGPATNFSVVVNQGILGVENSADALGGASGSATVNNGAVLGVWGALSIPTPVTLNTGSTLRALGGAAATWSGPITLGGDATIEGAAANVMNLSGSLGETGGAHTLQIRNTTTTGGTYTFTLSNTSTRTGPTTLTGSLFRVENDTALGSGPVTIQSNGTATVLTRLDLAGVTVANNINLASNAQTGFFGPVTAVGGVTSTASGIMNVTTNVGNGGHFASSGAGSVLRLTGTLNTTGPVPNLRQGTIEMGTTGGNLTQLNQGEGILRLVADNGIQSTVRLNLAVSNPGTLDLNSYSQSLAELRRHTTHAATVTNGGTGPSVLTINGAVDHAFSGTINDGAGGISLVKSGTSIWTLSGANTYTGTTTVNGGTLLINANHAAATGEVTVNNSGTLGGTSTVGGNLTVKSGGALAPGDGIGTLTTNGLSTLEPGGILAAQINSSAPSADQWFANGAVNISGAVLSLSDVAGSPAPITTGTKFTLIDYGPNSLTGTFNGLAEGATVSAGINNFTISYTDGNKVTLTSTGSSDPFLLWATAAGLDGSPGKEAGFEDDPDGDGIDNGLEWILGGNPLDGQSGGLVTATASAGGGLTLSFTRNEDAVGNATLTVEYNATLANPWNSATVGATSSGPDANGVTVTINTAATPDTVTLNIPAANAAAGKLFGRLKATKP